jgi:hypothetical protein
MVHPDKAAKPYRRETWQKNAKEGAGVWKATAHFYLEAFDALEELRVSRDHLAEAAGMTTLDLGKKAR